MCFMYMCPIIMNVTEPELNTDWSECTVTCGGGKQLRINNGITEERDCNIQSCDERTTNMWSECTVTCGGGKQLRNNNGKTEVRECNTQSCNVWSDWIWSDCSVTCGPGQKTGTRKCLADDPYKCVGPDVKIDMCFTDLCPVILNATEPPQNTEWSECSVTCGGGIKTRYLNGNLQEKSCQTQACTRWANWSEWSSCSFSCGDKGIMTSSRSCVHGRISNGGCYGDSIRVQNCNRKPCGQWSSWATTSDCSKSCDGGITFESRECLGGNVGDDGCSGDTIRTKPCNTQPCIRWSPWKRGECSTTCGMGISKHERACEGGNQGEGGCQGESVRFETCKGETEVCPQWSEWGEYSQCDVTCGSGMQFRNRECNFGEGACGDGVNMESRRCKNEECDPCVHLKDSHSKCGDYSLFCQSYRVYMTQNCPQTCCRVKQIAKQLQFTIFN